MPSEIALFGGPKAVTIIEPHYIWPRITPELENAVLAQLRSGVLSIYDRSDIFARFEDAFVAYHGGLMPHALVQNSGTSALWSIYVGAGLGPGDEVIVPTYSFYATYSPLMWTGATPVFCDAAPDGNIDPAAIESLITPQTRAVVVTHMWGLPCDMPTIVQICQRRGLLLIEDCSHAPGAELNGTKVGTFGDAAAWSLQGQKVVTAGEAGIMMTRNREIFYRALLLGQYNKRPKQQMPHDHPLYRFALTGFGLKLRAHPLAISIAMQQFGHLDEWIAQKHQYAMMMSGALERFPFITVPNVRGQPAWYGYLFQYDEIKAGVPISLFEQALRAEGLSEVDRPGSTRPNHDLPLFTTPDVVLPHLYRQDQRREEHRFPRATRFHERAIKLPVWAFADEEQLVRAYLEGIVKVAQAIQEDPETFRKKSEVESAANVRSST